MTPLRTCACWAGFALALLMSPAIIVFGAPFAYGAYSDLVATAWLAPAALTLAVLVAMNAARRGTTQAQAAKSMT